MAQNTSSAVMQQRTEAHDSLDDFPTPPWATRALLEQLELIYGLDFSEMICAEPAANRGYMVKPLTERFQQVIASDIKDYGMGYDVQDYLLNLKPVKVDLTFTNPPFKLGEQFIRQALNASRVGVAMFVRSSFNEGVGRYSNLFEPFPETHVFQFAERVVIHKGVLRDPEVKYWNPNAKNKDGTKGAWQKPTTATSYCWIVWLKNSNEPSRFSRIAPCRRRLELAGDYPSTQSETAKEPGSC